MAKDLGPSGWLPGRGVMLHIGPHKTGTTAIQSAFAAARPALHRRGIIYPGVASQQRMPALAITDSRGIVGLRTPQLADWDTLVADVHAARRRRVLVSSESFVEADDQAIRRIVDGLGGERVHVVVTLRPLAKILPSAWQQAVRNRLRLTYDDWLDEVLNQASARRAIANFWRRHRHGEVVERWMSVVGQQQIAVIVVDDVDRLMLTRSFESLLGLPDGFLVAENVRDNRGLTAAEVELVRRLNIDFRERRWPSVLYHEVIALGAVMQLQTRTPAPEEARIVTPSWAVERANQLTEAAVARIRGLDVVVMGDLDSLSAVPIPVPGPGTVIGTDDRLPASAAELALAGATSGLSGLQMGPERILSPVEVVGARELARLAGRRLTRLVSAQLGLGIRRY